MQEKILFLDMDNTIAENKTCKDIAFYDGLYENKEPIQFMINAIEEVLRPTVEKVVIISKTQGEEKGKAEKVRWLNNQGFKYDELLCINPTDKKTSYMLMWCYKNNRKPEECLLIDDKKDILQDAESCGFHTIYPQNLLVEYWKKTHNA